MSQFDVEFEPLPVHTCVGRWSENHIIVPTSDSDTLVIRVLSGSITELRGIIRERPSWLSIALIGKRGIIRGGELYEVRAA